jgi:hypothetical protein
VLRVEAAAFTAAAACAVHPSDVATGAAIDLVSAWLTRHALHLIVRCWTS